MVRTIFETDLLRIFQIKKLWVITSPKEEADEELRKIWNDKDSQRTYFCKHDENGNYCGECIWIEETDDPKLRFVRFCQGVEYLVDEELSYLGIECTPYTYEIERENSATETKSYTRTLLVRLYVENEYPDIKLEDECTKEYCIDMFEHPILKIRVHRETEEELAGMSNREREYVETTGGTCDNHGNIFMRENSVSTLVHELGHYFDHEIGKYSCYHMTSLKLILLRRVLNDFIQ